MFRLRMIFFVMSLVLLAGCGGGKIQLQDPLAAARQPSHQISPDLERRLELDLRSKGKSSTQMARAFYLLGQARFNRKEWKSAGRLFQKGVKEFPGTGWDKISLWMVARTLEALGRPGRAFVQYQKLVETPGYSTLPGQAARACERIARQELDEKMLAKVIRYPAKERFQPLLRYLLLKKISARGQTDAVVKGVEQYLSLYPDSVYVSELETLVKGVFKLAAVQPRKIGVVLPGQGSSFEREGSRVLAGFRMAFEEVNATLPEEKRFQMIVADEGGNTMQAKAAAQRLVEEEEVIALLGPLLSDSALAIAAYASTRRVPVLSSSAGRGGLTEVGSYFFRNCVTPAKLGRMMADYALMDMRVTRVATVWPRTWYGQSLAESFEDRFVDLGGAIPVSVSYPAGTEDFKKAMLLIGGVDPGLEKKDVNRRRKEIRAEVELASLKLANFLLALKPLSPTAQTQVGSEEDFTQKSQERESALDNDPEEGESEALAQPEPIAELIFPLRLAVVDFATTTMAAQLEAGRAISARFQRVLDQVDELVALSPVLADRWMKERGLEATTLNPADAVSLARDLEAPLVFGGTVREVEPDWESLQAQSKEKGDTGRQARREMTRFTRYVVFQVTAHIFDARTGSITAFQEFEFKKLKAAEKNPFGLQAIFTPSSYKEAWGIADTLDFFDLDIPMLGADSWHTRRLLKHAEALEGARFTTGFDPEDTRPATVRFVQAYKDRYAETPRTLSAQAYDAAHILLKVLRKGADTREAVKRGLLGIRNYEGASARITFGGRNDALRSIPVMGIENGEWKRLR